jgi:hypothetical protein
MKGEITHLIGKDVEVAAHGIVYRGRLIEIGAEEVYLKGDAGWITLMVGDVEDIRQAGEPKPDRSSNERDKEA